MQAMTSTSFRSNANGGPEREDVLGQPEITVQTHITMCARSYLHDRASVMAAAWCLPQLTPKEEHHFKYTCVCVLNVLKWLGCQRR